MSALTQSRDGKRILAGSTFGSVALFDTESGSKLLELHGHSGAITTVCIHSDEYDLVSGDSAGHVRLWRKAYETARHEILGLSPPEAQEQTVVFSSDGESLAAVSKEEGVTVLSRDNLHRQFAVKDANSVLRIDSAGVVTGLGTNGDLHRWASNGDRIETVAFPWASGLTTAAAISADGQTIVATSNGRELAIVRTATQPILFLPTIGQTALHKLTVSEAGQFAAAVVDEINVHVWNVENPSDALILPYAPRVEDISFSSDGRLLAVCFINGEVAIVDVVERRTLHMFRVSSAAVRATFAPDSTRLVCIARNGTLHIYRTSDWREVATLEDEPGHLGAQSRVASIAFSPDGRALAVHRHDGKLRLWRAP